MKVKIRQIVSAIGTTDVQKANLRSLKLGRIGKSSVFDNSSKDFLGRLAVVKHLVSVEEYNGK